MQDTDLPAGTDTTVARRSVFPTLRQISIIQHELFEFEPLLICCTISLTSLSTSHPAPPWKAYQGAYSRQGREPVSWGEESVQTQEGSLSRPRQERCPTADAVWSGHSDADQRALDGDSRPKGVLNSGHGSVTEKSGESYPAEDIDLRKITQN